jgi:hypothetical protein
MREGYAVGIEALGRGERDGPDAGDHWKLAVITAGG